MAQIRSDRRGKKNPSVAELCVITLLSPHGLNYSHVEKVLCLLLMACDHHYIILTRPLPKYPTLTPHSVYPHTQASSILVYLTTNTKSLLTDNKLSGVMAVTRPLSSLSLSVSLSISHLAFGHVMKRDCS